jgi:DNA mismatch repair protein MutL
MGPIRALDAITISKIAAGEVVERPVSVVKELVENALDAGSAEVTVNIEDGGRRLIRVSDNGAGMSEADAAICLKSHTTSKLSTIDDLETILSMGFRGEALHSIGAVARLTVTTSDGAGAGWRVRMEGGAETPPEAAARVRGTTIEVENLFYNVPARRKFLKSARSEIQAIDVFISRMIVAYPDVRFVLTHNGIDVFRTGAAESYEERIRYVFGKDIAEKIVRASGTQGRMGVNAYFTMPDMTFPNRKYQIFFVNGRLVKDRHITVAVDSAYRGLIPGGRHGLAIVFLDMPASEVDANVHPAKTEVRFAAAHEIHSLIYRTLRGRFGDTGAEGAYETFTLNAQPFSKEPDAPRGMDEVFKKPLPRVQSELVLPKSDANKPDEFEKHTPPAGEKTLVSGTGAALAPAHGGPDAGGREITLPEIESAGNSAGNEDVGRVERSRVTAGDFRVLGQFFKTYIFVILDGKPAFIDQHVASERIIYNELKRKSVSRPEQLQLISEPVEVPRDVFNTLAENLERVKAAGIEVEPFGERAFVIRSTAHRAGPFDPASLLIAIASEISATPYKAPENVLTEKLLTVAACKLAVKAGQELSTEEMGALVGRYLGEEFNRTCPHGRPIIHAISQENLNAWFKR